MTADDEETYSEYGVPQFLGNQFPPGVTALKFTVNKDMYSRGLVADVVRGPRGGGETGGGSIGGVWGVWGGMGWVGRVEGLGGGGGEYGLRGGG